MNDNVPRMLRRLTPRPAPAELRGQVLDAVERELGRRRKPRWEHAFERSVAAFFLIAVALACWRTRTEVQWQSRVYSPCPVDSSIMEVANVVASVTDEETGRWVQEQLSAAISSRRDDVKSRLETYQRILDEF